MSFLRASTFSRLTRRAPIHCRTLATTPFRRAQGYGHGDNNQDTSTTSTQESAEHPGPAAPADASAESGGSRSKEAKETGYVSHLLSFLSSTLCSQDQLLLRIF